jgi:hypothetical protein
MPDKIDYDFISKLEGGRQTTGYVPVANTSQSGVTIATGFDLGQKNENDLNVLNLPQNLIDKLKPYLGKKKTEAEKFLKTYPLIIEDSYAQIIDKAFKKNHTQELNIKYSASRYNKKKIAFFSLLSEAQTVIASVSFQYGVNLNIRTPNFWKAVSSQNWMLAIHELRNFGDAYSTRRKKEAKLLEKIKNKSRQSNKISDGLPTRQA